MTIKDATQRATRTADVGTVDSMRAQGISFVRVNEYTVAYKAHDPTVFLMHPKYRGGGVILVATTICNPNDEDDPIRGAIEAGARLQRGEAMFLMVPKGRNVRRYLRRVLSV
jgi:hypothetical protein